MGMYVPLGPFHPAFKEPLSIKIKIEGETIVDAEIDMGYNHRGIEKILEKRLWVSVPFIAEHICGICSGVHQMTAIMGIERIYDIEDKIPERAIWIRVLGLELERIHSHLLWLGIALHEAGFDTIFMLTWRDRERVLDVLEILGGRRVVYSIGRVGGVRYDVDDKTKKMIIDVANFIRERCKVYKKYFEEDPTLLARFRNVSVLPTSVAKGLNTVGPTARASNVPYDIREEDGYYIYGPDIGYRTIVRKECDAFAKVMVRIEEVEVSADIIEHIAKNLPSGPIEIKPKVPHMKAPAPGEVIARMEAPRGELFYYYKSDGKPYPYRVKVRTPTLSNILSVAYMAKGEYIADVPVTFASIDPCIACMERVLIIDDGKHRKPKRMTWSELIRYSKKWFKQNLSWLKQERL